MTIPEAVQQGVEMVRARTHTKEGAGKELATLYPELGKTPNAFRKRIEVELLKANSKNGHEALFNECDEVGIPVEDVKHYWHKGKRFSINAVNKKGDSLPSYDFIEDIVQKHVSPVYVESQPVSKDHSHWFDRLVYTDTHIGMDTNKDGIAMYATQWDKAEQLRRAAIMVKEVIANKTSNILYIDELGDFMDGWDGFTTRGGHLLPQNMSNESAFDTGMDFKMLLVDNLVNYYDHIHIHNICNDNHAGAFGYIVNSAVKRLVDVKYKGKVTIDNQRQFINHYFVAKHAFVTTHGKDSKTLKFGFKPVLTAPQILKIDGYLKNFKIYRDADFIEFSKGDSHQLLLDYTTTTDFNYFNILAFSPSSEWVQNNFQKGVSGFVLQNIMYNENVKNIIPKFF